jgi:hypothetical protein
MWGAIVVRKGLSDTFRTLSPSFRLRPSALSVGRLWNLEEGGRSDLRSPYLSLTTLDVRFVLRFHMAAGIRSSKSQLRTLSESLTIYFPYLFITVLVLIGLLFVRDFYKWETNGMPHSCRVHTSQLMFVTVTVYFGFQRVIINTLPCLSSYNTFRVLPWVQSKGLAAWIRLQLLPPASQMYNSEYSSLEEQMPGKLRFCRESATQQRIQ